MSLYSYLESGRKYDDKLKWVYSRRALYNYKLEYGLAKQRLQKMFARTEVERMVDEVC